jgi:hypothetical protein
VRATVATVDNGHLHVREESAFVGRSLSRGDIPNLEKVIAGFGGGGDAATLEGRRMMKIAYRACLDTPAGPLFRLLNEALCLAPETHDYETVREAVDASKNPATRALRKTFEKFVDAALADKDGTTRLPYVINILLPHVEKRADIFVSGGGRTDCLGCNYCRGL